MEYSGDRRSISASWVLLLLGVNVCPGFCTWRDPWGMSRVSAPFLLLFSLHSKCTHTHFSANIICVCFSFFSVGFSTVGWENAEILVLYVSI